MTTSNTNPVDPFKFPTYPCNKPHQRWKWACLAKRRHAGLVIERQEIATMRHKKISRPFLARSPAEGLETISVLHHTKNKSDFDIVVRGGVAFDRTLDYGKAGFGAISTSIQLSSNVRRIQTATLNGLLVGVGVEHAFTFAPN
jgi:hypothetical protein